MSVAQEFIGRLTDDAVMACSRFPALLGVSGFSTPNDVLRPIIAALDVHPEKMRQRRERVEHPFGTIKIKMGATHHLMKRLPNVATEMAQHVFAYNLTRVIIIPGSGPLMAATRA